MTNTAGGADSSLRDAPGGDGTGSETASLTTKGLKSITGDSSDVSVNISLCTRNPVLLLGMV